LQSTTVRDTNVLYLIVTFYAFCANIQPINKSQSEAINMYKLYFANMMANSQQEFWRSKMTQTGRPTDSHN